MTQESRTQPSKLAKQLIKYIRPQRPNYNYLRDLFRHLRKELDVSVTTAPKKLPVIPTEEEIKKYKAYGICPGSGIFNAEAIFNGDFDRVRSDVMKYVMILQGIH